MKVLLSASTYPRWEGDAVPVFVRELARALARLGWEVHVLAPHHAGAQREDEVDGVRVHRFRYAPARGERLAYGAGILPNVARNPLVLGLLPGFLLAQVGATRRILRREAIRCLNAHWIFPQGLAGLAARALVPGTRLVTTVHGGDIFALGRSALLRPLLRRVLRGSDAVTVNSSATAAAAGWLCPGVRTTLIPMGVDAGRFSPGRAEPALRAHLSSRGGPLLLSCGRLARKKGVRYLIEALPAILDRAPEARLAIVGEGEERAALEAQVRAAGLGAAVEFLGAISNERLPGLFASADLLVFPSIVDERGDTEGLGVVLLEAAASGLPAVASRIGGIPDAVRDGETGLLVEQKDPAQIAAAALRLLGDRETRRRMGERGRAMVEAEFTWARVAARFAQEFSAVMARPAAAG